MQSLSEPTLVNMGRGKIYSQTIDTVRSYHIDERLHNGINNDRVYYPSPSYVVLPPSSNVFKPFHKSDNLWKTTGKI